MIDLLEMDVGNRGHLKQDFSEHEIFIVRYKQWNGIKNGDLLKLLVDNSFDALLIYDKNLQHQYFFIQASPI